MDGIKKWFLVGAVFVLTVLLGAFPCAFAAEEALILPDSVVTVEAEAFAGSGITSLVVTSGVQSIESKAFSQCEMLSDVVLPRHDVQIADNAFEGCGDILFHAFSGTANERWALAHGFRCEGLNPDKFSQISAMLTRFDIPVSSLQGADKDFATCCLIIKASGGRLPDISRYQPTDIVQSAGGRFFVQFPTVADTENCYYELLANQSAWSIDYVEPDRYNSAIGGEVAAQQGVVSGWESDDPMGFSAYSAFVSREAFSSVTVAVLDSGFPSNAAYNDKLLTGKAFSFSRDNNPWSYDGCNHGRVVAAVLADCIGSAPINILPIRVSDARGRVDTISLITALEYAVSNGASLINMSLGFDDPNFTSFALEEAIQSCPATVIAAAGNFGNQSRNRYFPARLSRVISVGAANAGCALASYSCRDAHYAAPGSVQGAGLSKEGTSFAAPQITAALALLQLDPYHTIEDLQACCQPVNTTIYGMPSLNRIARYSVSSIRIENAPDTLVLGDVDWFELVCTVGPQTAEDKTFTYETSDPSVLSIGRGADGRISVQARDKGTATITVRSHDDPTVSDSKTITVIKPVTAVTVNPPQAEVLYLLQTMKLTASVYPADASNQKVEWMSSDTSVAKIGKTTGKITPVKEGTATFTATAADGYGAADSITLTIKKQPPAESVAVTAEQEADVYLVGSTLQLHAQAMPELAAQSFTWASLFPEIASISADGLVSFSAVGTAVFSAECADGSGAVGYYIASAKNKVDAISIHAPALSMEEEEEMQLTASVSPDNVIDQTVLWSVDDSSIGTISSTGLLTALQAGQVTVTAVSAADSSVSASVTITVCSKLPDIDKPTATTPPLPEPTPRPEEFSVQANGSILTISGNVEIDEEKAEEINAYRNEGITNVIIGEGIRSIGPRSFYGFNRLASVSIPSSVNEIASDAFGACDQLSDLFVSSSNSSYAAVNGILYSKDKTSLLYYPKGRREDFTVPSGVTAIGPKAFKGCFSFEVTLSDQVNEIHAQAFADTALTAIHLSDQITWIEDSAFSGADISSITANANTYAAKWMTQKDYWALSEPLASSLRLYDSQGAQYAAGETVYYDITKGNIPFLANDINTVRLMVQEQDNGLSKVRIIAYTLLEPPDYDDPAQISRKFGTRLIEDSVFSSEILTRLMLQSHINDSPWFSIHVNDLNLAPYIRVHFAFYYGEEAAPSAWYSFGFSVDQIHP